MKAPEVAKEIRNLIVQIESVEGRKRFLWHPTHNKYIVVDLFKNVRHEYFRITEAVAKYNEL